MQLLIPKTDLDSKGSRDLIPLKCYQCGKVHYRTKNIVLRILNGNLRNTQKGCFCSSGCKNKARTSLIQTTCHNCGDTVERIPSAVRSEFSFCGSNCAAKYFNTPKKVYRTCHHCSEKYHSSQGTRSKYCSRRCQLKHQTEKIYTQIDNGKYCPASAYTQTIKKYLVSRRGASCQKCELSKWIDSPINLTVNHIDGDAYNNSPKNLELLCWNCHSTTPNFGRRNKTSTRSYRYKKSGAATQNRTETIKLPT